MKKLPYDSAYRMLQVFARTHNIPLSDAYVLFHGATFQVLSQLHLSALEEFQQAMTGAIRMEIPPAEFAEQTEAVREKFIEATVGRRPVVAVH